MWVESTTDKCAYNMAARVPSAIKAGVYGKAVGGARSQLC